MCLLAYSCGRTGWRSCRLKERTGLETSGNTWTDDMNIGILSVK